MRKSTALPALHLAQMTTPLGDMLLVVDEQARLCVLDWTEYEERMHRLLRLHHGTDGKDFALQCRALPRTIRVPLREYFAGKLAAIDDIPVQTGGTAFQRKVWQTLRRIRAGSTLRYGELAARIGRPTAVRAVGHANGANPVGIVVPCHRIIGADGTLTGYGGGIERKRWLLEHEGVTLER